MRGGLAKTWAMVELGTRRTTEKVRDGNSTPTVARVVFLPDHSVIQVGCPLQAMLLVKALLQLLR